MVFRWSGILLPIFFLAAESVSAHPHVWVDVQTEVAIDGGVVKGLSVTWSLDDEFSQMILADSDTNGNGKIDPAEQKSVKTGYFDNLKLYDFFCHLYRGKDAVQTPVPQNFQADLLPTGKMRYRFFLPLNVKLTDSSTLAFSWYDETFYVDVEPEKVNPVILSVTGGGKAKVSFRPDKSRAFWGGEIIPNFAFISWGPP